MDTNVNYTLVGAFVIFLISSIILTIIWLSSGLSINKYTTYMVYMDESVSGLSMDSPVELNGVNVGKVAKVELNDVNPHLVDIVLSIKTGTPITQGTVAMLNSRGLTGVTYLSLKDKGTDLRPLLTMEGQPSPVIKTAPSFFLRLDAQLERLNKSLYRVSKAMQNLLDEENLRSIKDTLINLRQITGIFAAQGPQFRLILNNMSNSSQQFPSLLRSGEGTMQNLYSISNEIKQNPSVLIRGTGPQSLGPGEK